MQRPVRWQLHCQLQPLLVNCVRRGDLVHGCGDLDRHVLARELGRGSEGVGVLHAREFGADNGGREVFGGVGRDSG